MTQSILIFRIGQLGDTLAAVPALWALREHFPQAKLTLLSDWHSKQSYVQAADLLNGAGIIDYFESYRVNDRIDGRWVQYWHMLGILRKLRMAHYDTLVYLAPSNRIEKRVARDRAYFKLAGIRNFIGMDGYHPTITALSISPVPPQSMPYEADLLLARLAASGIPVPPPGHGRLDIGLGPPEEQAVQQWLASLPSDGGRPWIAIGPGSKMPVKIWPEDRFLKVLQALVERFHIWPVIFGGTEDQALGARLLAVLGCGYNAAGSLGLRPAMAAITRCRMYLGNDTGTMHMAAAVKCRCVAIFSARDCPGLWEPYGVGHRILRSPIACAGCMLQECIQRKMECVLRITVEDVLQACIEVLTEQLGRNPAPRIS